MFRFAFANIFITASLVFSALSHANLALSNYRLYFDAKNRANALVVRNTEKNPVKFTLELTHYDMTAEGTLIPVTDAQVVGRSAKKMLRYSPRRGVIQPNSRQAIRFNIRKPANLPTGEYRAVLRIISQQLISSNKSGITLTPKIAYSIPVIVRHGKLQAAAKLTNLQLIQQNSQPTLALSLSENGNRSLYGDFTIRSTTGEMLGEVKGIALYPPLNKRQVYIPLTQAYKGKVTVKFKERAEYGGNLVLTSNMQLN